MYSTNYIFKNTDHIVEFLLASLPWCWMCPWSPSPSGLLPSQKNILHCQICIMGICSDLILQFPLLITDCACLTALSSSTLLHFFNPAYWYFSSIKLYFSLLLLPLSFSSPSKFPLFCLLKHQTGRGISRICPIYFHMGHHFLLISEATDKLNLPHYLLIFVFLSCSAYCWENYWTCSF